MESFMEEAAEAATGGGGGSMSASDWAKGIALSIVASIIGGISKLAIRKSWLLQHQHRREEERNPNDDEAGNDNDDQQRQQADRHHDLLSDPSSGLGSTIDDDDPTLPLQERRTNNRCGPCCTTAVSSSSLTSPSIFCCDYDCSKSQWFPYVLRYTGMVGMSVLNPICCVLAMNYASPSILAPFSGLTLCWVILGSPCVNNEQPSKQQILACTFIIAGEVIVAIFGDHTNDEGVTIQDVKESYVEPAFVLYFVGLVLYVSVSGYLMKFSKSPTLRRFAWGSCGGCITGAQNFLKDSLTILKDVDQQQQKNGGELPWFFFFFVFMAAVTAFSGLLILTACMKRYDATYSAASFVGSFVVSASIMATVHYETFAGLHGLVSYVLYPLGLSVLMVGVYMLVRENSDDEEEEEAIDYDENKDEAENVFGYTQVHDDSPPEEEVV